MLPGFRFLFAATLLTLSLVVFGLGAAALLRASHDRFASLPIRPVAGPPLATVADTPTPTLSMLRIEPPEPTESRAAPELLAPRLPADTLMPNDKVATFVVAPRVEDVIPEPPVTVEPKAEPKADLKPEPKAEFRPEPPRIEAKAETVVEAPAQLIAPKAPVAEAASATPAPVSTPAEPTVKIDESAKVETPSSAPQQVAALAESVITGTVTTSTSIDPSLVNARPIRRPPVPRDRPADADVVAALPDPAVVAPAPEAEKPVVRRRRAVTKRVIRKRRSVTRPATQNPASPFGT